MSFIKNKVTPKIAVVGGTHFDSERGAKWLSEKGVCCTAIAISDRPEEQAELYRDEEKLKSVFRSKVGSKDFDEIILFCNSLSFAVDWAAIYPGRITELTEHYKDLLKTVNRQKTAIIVAEPSTKIQIENLAEKQGICSASALNIFPRLDLILQLEKSNKAKQKTLIIQAIDELKNKGFEEVIFGCTHLDHLDFYHLKDVKIHQPGLEMIDKFLSKMR